MHPLSVFSVRISRIAAPLTLAVLFLPACSLLIPENPSAPRYNSVLGPPRAPQLNPDRGPGPQSQAPAPMRITETTAMNFPPVDAQTQSRAQEIMASDVPPPAALPVSDQAPLARRMPEENMTVAQSSYPDLHSIPPTPPAGEEERLSRIRAQLEADRMAAGAAKNKLAADAAAEPSLLNEMPSIQAIPPVNRTPMPAAPMPQSQAPAMSAPATTASNTSYIALPPPLPPMGQSPMAPAPVSVAAAPTLQSAPLEPIMLRPPSGANEAAIAATPAFAPTPAPATTAPVAMAPAMAGGFNPMAGSAPINLRAPTSFAGGTEYLPNSRYSTRRN